MSDSIVRSLLPGWKRPLDASAKLQAGGPLHQDDAPLYYKVGPHHVVVARPPWGALQDHAAAAADTVEAACRQVLASFVPSDEPKAEERISREKEIPPQPASAAEELGAAPPAPSAARGETAYPGVTVLADEIAQAKTRLTLRVDAVARERLEVRVPPHRLGELNMARLPLGHQQALGISTQKQDDEIRAIDEEISQAVKYTRETMDFASSLKVAIDHKQTMAELTAFHVPSAPWPRWA